MDDLLHNSALDTVESGSQLRKGMAFLSENLEAFGFVSDAYPIVTDRWIIAAHGQETDVGAAAFVYPNVGGVAGLYEGIYAGVLDADETTTDMLVQTFGDLSDRREAPIARYVAALSESVALRVLSDAADDASHEQIAAELGLALPSALNALRENICSDGVTARDAELYTVSLAACRMTDMGGGSYILDWFTAGDYRGYLLDANGLRPLRLPISKGISPESDAAKPEGKRFRLRHPSPFAILLLSNSVCTVNAAEQQSMKENPGLAWRYRMRLETNVLRILTACVREEEFGERAGHFFMGRANGRESASGALTVFRGETPFSSIRADCLKRLRHVEDMIALLPDGYDPATVPRLPSRSETEIAYIRRLLAQEKGLAERCADALCALALDRLHHDPAEATPPPEDVPDYRRILPEDIRAVYRIYDCENEEDYACIRHNTAALREYVSEHWITLRPILLAVTDAWHASPSSVVESDVSDSAEESRSGEMAPSATTSGRALCDRAYETILRLNARLGELLDRRQTCLADAAAVMSEQGRILQARGDAWLHGRSGGDHAVAWADHASAELTETLRLFANTYEQTESEYRSILAAYISERDLLFAHDAEAPDGTFAAEWQAIQNGRLDEDRWAAYRAAIAEATEDRGDAYVNLWDDLRIISRGTGARYAQIHSRAADTRTARDIASRTEFRIAAIRASAYQDAEWGEHVCHLLDAAHRNSYQTMVRRWQETCELMARQAAAYEEYRALYEA